MGDERNWHVDWDLRQLQRTITKAPSTFCSGLQRSASVLVFNSACERGNFSSRSLRKRAASLSEEQRRARMPILHEAAGPALEVSETSLLGGFLRILLRLESTVAAGKRLHDLQHAKRGSSSVVAVHRRLHQQNPLCWRFRIAGVLDNAASCDARLA